MTVVMLRRIAVRNPQEVFDIFFHERKDAITIDLSDRSQGFTSGCLLGIFSSERLLQVGMVDPIPSTNGIAHTFDLFEWFQPIYTTQSYSDQNALRPWDMAPGQPSVSLKNLFQDLRIVAYTEDQLRWNGLA